MLLLGANALTSGSPVYRKSGTRLETGRVRTVLLPPGMITFRAKTWIQSVTLLNLEIALPNVMLFIVGTACLYFFL
jgi:hypothetical protein